MLKKLVAAVVLVIVFSVMSIGAFATQDDGTGNTTLPAINYGSFPSNLTGTAIKDISTSKSAISSGSAISKEGATAGGASDSNANAEKRTDFKDLFNSLLENGNAVSDKEFLVTITSPDKDKDSTYSQSYILSGNSEYSDIVIAVAKYNEKTGKYAPLSNTDGESSWNINASRMFSNEIPLDMGVNKIKLIFYRTSQMKDADRGIFQINCFTIERLNKSIAETVIKKPAEIVTDIGKSISDGVKSTINLLTGKK